MKKLDCVLLVAISALIYCACSSDKKDDTTGSGGTGMGGGGGQAGYLPPSAGTGGMAVAGGGAGDGPLSGGTSGAGTGGGGTGGGGTGGEINITDAGVVAGGGGFSGGGGSGTGGDTGGTGGDTGGAGGDTGGTGGTPDGGSTGGPRTMGYVGCSMSVNVAEGYQTLGGERLWPPIAQYNGKVVQNWTNNSDSAWQAFDQQVTQYGVPTDVWVMICIFSNQVTYDETKQIIANLRQRVPDATIYITGQPLYEAGLTCSLAGVGGPELTDQMAQQAGNDSTQNVIYGGTFGPLSSAHTAGDMTGCHANAEGQQFLGQQAIDKWGM